jgi:hypothetical protein
MRELYENQIIDYNDGYTEFVSEFDEEIAENGAIVYNHENNSYQFITRFDQIDFKQEIGPYYFKVKKSKLPNGMDIIMSYEFDPSGEEDEEVLAVWKEIQSEKIPYFDYHDEGELYQSKEINYSADPTVHTIWILTKNGYDFILNHDMLVIQPIIKYFQIVQELLRNHTTTIFDSAKH